MRNPLRPYHLPQLSGGDEVPLLLRGAYVIKRANGKMIPQVTLGHVLFDDHHQAYVFQASERRY